MITHYADDSATDEWLDAQRDMEAEDSWTPAQRFRRVVSLDFISGCADGGIIEEAA
jgi:hypothetical protein